MALILYGNVIRNGTPSSIGTVSGSIANLIDGRTSTSESFASGATREFIIDYGSATNVNCLGVARSNLYSVGATVTIQGSTDNVSYSTLFSLTPTNGDVQVKLDSTTHSYRYYKIQISGHSNTVNITDIAIGEAKILERDQAFGFKPPVYADGDTVIPNITRGRNLVGLTIKQGPKRIKLSLPYYTVSFFSDWAILTDSIKKFPFYLVWKGDNTSEAFYCWPYNKVPEPKYSKNISGYAYLDTTLDLEGITF